ncbi:MAG: hypothetical protein LUC92_03590 [Clostridiales bacterium]|nr:hypothetical protein [Clostridiales bacterium]
MKKKLKKVLSSVLALTMASSSLTVFNSVSAYAAFVGFDETNITIEGSTEKNYVEDRNGYWYLHDETSTNTTSLTLPLVKTITPEVADGSLVTISGSATPSVNGSSWSFVQIKSDSLVAAFTSDGSRYLCLRVNDSNGKTVYYYAASEGEYSSTTLDTSADLYMESYGTYDYVFTFDLSNETVQLEVTDVYNNNKTYYYKADILNTTISNIYAVTSISGSRNLTISDPVVRIENGIEDYYLEGAMGDDNEYTEGSLTLTDSNSKAYTFTVKDSAYYYEMPENKGVPFAEGDTLTVTTPEGYIASTDTVTVESGPTLNGYTYEYELSDLSYYKEELSYSFSGPVDPDNEYTGTFDIIINGTSYEAKISDSGTYTLNAEIDRDVVIALGDTLEVTAPAGFEGTSGVGVTSIEGSNIEGYDVVLGDVFFIKSEADYTFSGTLEGDVSYDSFTINVNGTDYTPAITENSEVYTYSFEATVARADMFAEGDSFTVTAPSGYEGTTSVKITGLSGSILDGITGTLESVSFSVIPEDYTVTGAFGSGNDYNTPGDTLTIGGYTFTVSDDGASYSYLFEDLTSKPLEVGAVLAVSPVEGYTASADSVTVLSFDDDTNTYTLSDLYFTENTVTYTVTGALRGDYEGDSFELTYGGESYTALISGSTFSFEVQAKYSADAPFTVGEKFEVPATVEYITSAYAEVLSLNGYNYTLDSVALYFAGYVYTPETADASYTAGSYLPTNTKYLTAVVGVGETSSEVYASTSSEEADCLAFSNFTRVTDIMNGTNITSGSYRGFLELTPAISGNLIVEFTETLMEGKQAYIAVKNSDDTYSIVGWATEGDPWISADVTAGTTYYYFTHGTTRQISSITVLLDDSVAERNEYTFSGTLSSDNDYSGSFLMENGGKYYTAVTSGSTYSFIYAADEGTSFHDQVFNVQNPSSGNYNVTAASTNASAVTGSYAYTFDEAVAIELINATYTFTGALGSDNTYTGDITLTDGYTNYTASNSGTAYSFEVTEAKGNFSVGRVFTVTVPAGYVGTGTVEITEITGSATEGYSCTLESISLKEETQDYHAAGSFGSENEYSNPGGTLTIGGYDFTIAADGATFTLDLLSQEAAPFNVGDELTITAPDGYSAKTATVSVEDFDSTSNTYTLGEIVFTENIVAYTLTGSMGSNNVYNGSSVVLTLGETEYEAVISEGKYSFIVEVKQSAGAPFDTDAEFTVTIPDGNYTGTTSVSVEALNGTEYTLSDIEFTYRDKDVYFTTVPADTTTDYVTTYNFANSEYDTYKLVFKSSSEYVEGLPYAANAGSAYNDDCYVELTADGAVLTDNSTSSSTRMIVPYVNKTNKIRIYGSVIPTNAVSTNWRLITFGNGLNLGVNKNKSMYIDLAEDLSASTGTTDFGTVAVGQAIEFDLTFDLDSCTATGTITNGSTTGEVNASWDSSTKYTQRVTYYTTLSQAGETARTIVVPSVSFEEKPVFDADSMTITGIDGTVYYVVPVTEEQQTENTGYYLAGTQNTSIMSEVGDEVYIGLDVDGVEFSLSDLGITDPYVVAFEIAAATGVKIDVDSLSSKFGLEFIPADSSGTEE